MAAYGFGGLGATFPTRNSAPNSNTVDALPFGSWDDYNNDWQGRYNAEMARARAPSTSTYQAEGFGGTPSWFDANVATFGGDANNQAAVAAAEQLANSYGLTLTNNYGGSPTLGKAADAFHTVTSTDQGYTPNVSGLRTEFDKMQGLYNNQAAQQQAYNKMQGNYQFNGNLSGDYSNPNFGQVNGLQVAQSVPSGLQSAVGSGTYGGGVQMTGVYNPQEQKKTWNF